MSEVLSKELQSGSGFFVAGVEYIGADFCGWQRQSHRPSIQAEVEGALSQVANHSVTVQCAGRTDRGVHALGQVIHFESKSDRSIKAWQQGANSLLPKSVALSWVKAMPQGSDFHARFSAEARRYLYVIYVNHSHRPILHQHATWQRYPLDVGMMKKAASYFKGEQDYSALRSSECQSKSPWRNIHHVKVQAVGNRVVIDCQANAFLHHMVRNIVGLLLEVGMKKQPSSWVKAVLESKDRTLGAPTAPSAGLYLTEVMYPAHYNLPQLNSINISSILPI